MRFIFYLSFLFAITQSSCDKPRQSQNKSSATDSISIKSPINTYIEDELLWLIEKFPDDSRSDSLLLSCFKIRDSIHIPRLQCVLYSIDYFCATDDDSYTIIRDLKTNRFFKIVHHSWPSLNSQLKIDEAYIILEPKNYVIEPVEFQFQAIEDFFNQSRFSRNKLTITDIDLIYKNLGYRAFQNEAEIAINLNQLNKDYREVGYKNSKYTDLIVKLLSKRLNSNYISIYNLEYGGILYVELNPTYPIERFETKEKLSSAKYDEYRDYRPKGINNIRFLKIR